jgi:MFS family permease
MNDLVGKLIGGLADYRRHLHLFSRNVRLFLWASFLIGLTMSGYLLLMNLYLRESGASESFIGMILSAGSVGMTVTSIPAALLLRRIRLKPILIAGAAVYAISVFFLAWLPIANPLIIISFAGGVAITFNRVAAAPFFMRNSTRRERTYIFSLSFGVMLIASVLGSLAFGWTVTALTSIVGGLISAYRWTLAISVGFALVAIIPLSLILAARPGNEDRKAVFSVALIRKRLRLYMRLFLPYFIVGLGAGLIIPFLNLYFRDRFNQPPDKIGLFYMAVNATMLLGILAGPVLVKKMGMVRTLVSTQLLSLPFMVVLAYTYSVELAFAAFLIRGALMNMGQPIGTNFGMEMVGEHEHALVNALFMVGWNSSWMISAVIGGRLIEKYGYTLPLMITVGLYIISSILYYIFFNSSEKKTESGYMVVMPQ